MTSNPLSNLPPRKLEKTTAAATRRYSRKILFSRGHLPVNTQTEVLPPNLPSGWKKYIHPEGQPYYHHNERRLLTEANLERPEVATLVESWCKIFQESANEHPIQFSEVVFDLDEENQTCKYYLIDHEKQMECWLDSTDSDALGMDMSCNAQHLALQLREHYWTHCEYFPMHRSLPTDAEGKIIALLGHAITDQLTSEDSTAPYTAAECERLIKVIKDFEGSSGEKQLTIARFYRVFVHSHFVNLFGQDGARLARNQSVLDEATDQPSLVLDTISCSLFFGIPQSHSQILKGLWVDRVVYIEHWRSYLQRLETEWFRSIVLAGLFLMLDTVIIAADPHVDQLPWLGIALSSIFSLGSIISGIAQIYRHQINLSDNAVSAGTYLESTYHPKLGHQPLSISYALPLATAFWSIVTFSGGLLTHVYGAHDGNYARAILGMGVAVAATVLWSVFGT